MTQILDAEETARLRRARAERIGRWLMPVLTVVAAGDLGPHRGPKPDPEHPARPRLVAQTLVKDWAILGPATWATLVIAMMALGVAVIGGGWPCRPSA